MPRAGLHREAIVAIALDLIDGGEAVSLARVAERAGVKTPSLYKHIAGLDELQDAVSTAILLELTASLDAAAALAPDDRLLAVLDGYRAWALGHPFRYLALPVQPREHPAMAEAAAELLAVFAAALTGHAPSVAEPGGESVDAETVHRVRGLRAAAHGFVLLELGGGFAMPADVEESYRRLCATLIDNYPEPRVTIEQ